MLSNKEIVCPNNLLDVAHKKKGVKAAIVNAGLPLPMLSIQGISSFEGARSVLYLEFLRTKAGVGPRTSLDRVRRARDSRRHKPEGTELEAVVHRLLARRQRSHRRNCLRRTGGEAATTETAGRSQLDSHARYGARRRPPARIDAWDGQS